MMWHAHVESHSKDCDGVYDLNYDQMGEDDFDDLDMINYIMSTAWLYPGPDNESKITLTWEREGRHEGEPMSDLVRLMIWVSRNTDEGYEAVVYTICDQDDYSDEVTQRDHTAERMGY